MAPIVAVVGYSDSGKTTFLEKLIPCLKRKGIRLAVAKHDTHGFEMDKPGKDTWRIREAGADVVAISSPHRMAMIVSGLDREMTLEEVADLAGGMVDLVLTEGYKSSKHPKIEVFRQALGREKLLCDPAELLAVVSDVPHPVDVPQFGLEDAEGVADLLAKHAKK
jgi:molybdopterin-guanine dinucleotide biosynthesis adapter protein